MQVVTHEELAGVIEALGNEIRRSMLDAAKAAQKPEYYNKEDAARYLSISESSLDRLAAAGEIRRAKLTDTRNSTVLFRRCDLDAFVDSRLELDAEGARRKAREIRRRG